jgi:hypothetical protein
VFPDGFEREDTPAATIRQRFSRGFAEFHG